MLRNLKAKAMLSKSVIKQHFKTVINDEKGGTAVLGLVIVGILLIAVIASSPTLNTFVTDLTADVTSFFSTKINGILN